MQFQQTRLWKAAFATNSKDPDAKARNFLNTQLLDIRSRVEKLITQIPADCKGLTVHDISHLDAVWEMADLIAGENFPLNPAEVFVLGASIYLHDAGLTSILYSGGRDGIKKTTKWKEISDANPNLSEDDTLFAALRSMHAKQAEKIATESIAQPGHASSFIISDDELRTAYGHLIGKIAHSHHWEIEKLSTEIQDFVGGSPNIPRNWSLRPLKIACLLRCADAAQIDRVRAPTLLYSAIAPTGHSGIHWKAQNNLNSPILVNGSIRINASRDFKEDEADAWWMAYDLAKLLDRELHKSNALLAELDLPCFAAQRVAGAESSLGFCKFVRTEKWRPIDASIRITDPLKIAAKLGGRNLYGSSRFVPIRELIQNSADAIRARAAIEEETNLKFGKIVIEIEEDANDPEFLLISVCDNGIGMSEQTMSTTLVDFGRSIWDSGLVSEDFPRLQIDKVRHIGKFGIGFFSVFDMSETVEVSSRLYNSAHSSTKTLKFKKLRERPVLSENSTRNMKGEISTRVTLKIKKDRLERPSNERNIDIPSYIERRIDIRPPKLDFIDEILAACVFLDITLEIKDLTTGSSKTNSGNPYALEAEQFLAELPFSNMPKRHFFDPTSTLKAILSKDGKLLGRAALDVDSILEGSRSSFGYLSVGGIIPLLESREVYSSTGHAVPFIGVMEAETEHISRSLSSPIASREEIDSWILQQISEINTNALRRSEVMKISAFSYLSTGKKLKLPYAFLGGTTATTEEVVDFIFANKSISLPLSLRYEDWFATIPYGTLNMEFFEEKMAPDIIVLYDESSRIIEQAQGREIARNLGGPVDFQTLKAKRWEAGESLLRMLKEAWGDMATARIEKRKIFDTKVTSLSHDRWVLTLSNG